MPVSKQVSPSEIEITAGLQDPSFLWMSLNLIKPSSFASRKLHLMHFIVFSKFQHFHSLVFDPLVWWCGKSTSVLLRPVVQIFMSIQNLTSLKTSLHVLYLCHFPQMSKQTFQSSNHDNIPDSVIYPVT